MTTRDGRSGRATGAMTEARIAALIAAYGAAPERWPAGERAAVKAALAASPRLRRHRDDEAALDALLDAAPPAPAPSAALQAGLAWLPMACGTWRAGAPAGRGGWQALVGLTGDALRPAAGLAAAVVLGIAVGLWTGPGSVPAYAQMDFAEIGFLAGDGALQTASSVLGEVP